MPWPLVYAFHSVAYEVPPHVWPDMVVLAGELAEEVRHHQSEGRRFLTAGELCDELDAGKDVDDAVVLTFDDGWLDALTITAPLLDDLGVRGTFFLSPELFGNEDRRMSPEGRIMTRAEARALHETGMELGAHSMRHPDLREMEDVPLRWELEVSKSEIEDITGEPCRTMAYPSGAHDARVRAATRAAGYELAFAFRVGPWDRFAVPRVPKPTV